MASSQPHQTERPPLDAIDCAIGVAEGLFTAQDANGWAFPTMAPNLADEIRAGRAALSVVTEQMEQARTFLASIASADPQNEQAAWMVEQAREGLRRAGGHDFDA
jgi:hypothetical protein